MPKWVKYIWELCHVSTCCHVRSCCLTSHLQTTTIYLPALWGLGFSSDHHATDANMSISSYFLYCHSCMLYNIVCYIVYYYYYYNYYYYIWCDRLLWSRSIVTGHKWMSLTNSSTDITLFPAKLPNINISLSIFFDDSFKWTSLYKSF